MLYLDGGVVVVSPNSVVFAGFTSATTTGNIGGLISAHAMCQAQFAGSHFCTSYEFTASNPAIALTAPAAWVDFSDSTNNLRYAPGGCSNWSYSGSAFNNIPYAAVLPNGYVVSDTLTPTCASTLPLACCYGNTPVRFRGFTTATTSGNIGGLISAHAMCQAQFAGSHFCTSYEFTASNPAIPLTAPAAWVDFSDSTNRLRYAPGGCSDWSYSGSAFNNIPYAAVLPNGYVVSDTLSPTCASTLPLACCQ